MSKALEDDLYVGCASKLKVEVVPFGYPVIFDILPDLDTFYRDWLGRPLKTEYKFEDRSYNVIKRWKEGIGSV